MNVKEIQRAYNDNADYMVDNSIEKCRLFIVACVRILGLPKRAMERGQGTSAEHEFDTEVIYQQQQAAELWLRQNAPPPSTEYGDIEVIDVDFRPGACRR